MAGIDNLTPFKPGQSGNPKGKPKGTTSIVTELRRLMEKRMPVNDPITGRPVRIKIKQLVAMSLIKSALNGKPEAAGQIIDRLEGKVAQTMNLNGAMVSNTVNVVQNHIDGMKDDDLDGLVAGIIARRQGAVGAGAGGESQKTSA